MTYLRFEEGVDIDHLSHFGVKGMHWGVWNEETRQRRMGGKGRRTLASQDVSSRKGLTDKQKTALKVAAGVAVVAGVAGISYLALKNGHGVAGKKVVADILDQSLDKTDDVVKTVVATTKRGTQVHSVSETMADSLKKANPTGNMKNCPVTSMTGILRQSHGIDCSAKAFDHPPEALDMVRECFPGCKTIPRTIGSTATARIFGKSRADAEQMILKNFGENASGFVGFQWKGQEGGAGHVISFFSKDGKVSFYDFQTGKEHGNGLWDMIDVGGMLQMARIDDVAPDFDALEKYVKFH